MDTLLAWVTVIAVTVAVIGFARWRQLGASRSGLADLPTRPYFAIPDEPAAPGSRNARLVLTTWDLVKQNVAEATLKSAAIGYTIAEMTDCAGDEVRGGPYYQTFVLDEAQAPEARRIVRDVLMGAQSG